MEARILWNDLKGSPMLAVTTWLFMAISAFLFALTCFLAIGLLGSVNTLMTAAQTPDFLQMHTGQIDEAALVQFAQQQEQVQDYQTLRFLNLENSSITLGGNSLSDSTQDNGVCVQSGRFDYLVDLENRVIDAVQSGEIYVPVCYRQKYGLNVGETVQIGDFDFTIAGFLRDSQMNAMMASSKRFLVSESDYLLLKNAGSEESLIEFLLRMGIEGLAHRKITEVSGGQLQRACICRSMMSQPKILFADEPTGALNQSAAQEVMEEFTRLNQEGTTILMVTHDSKVAARCGRILYLLDVCIKGEFSPSGAMGEKEREAAVSRWLAEMGW